MKKQILLSLAFLGMLCSSLAQVPQGFTYQAVAVNATGLELVNQEISLQVSIISDSISGGEQWIETHFTSTDDFGLFTLVIGQGTAVSGSLMSNFSEIQWGTANHYIKIEMNTSGGSDYQLLGISQLMSVPYALYAKEAENSSSTSGTGSNANTLIYTVGGF